MNHFNATALWLDVCRLEKCPASLVTNLFKFPSHKWPEILHLNYLKSICDNWDYTSPITLLKKQCVMLINYVQVNPFPLATKKQHSFICNAEFEYSVHRELIPSVSS